MPYGKKTYSDGGYRQMNDQELLSLLQQHDKRAFDEIYERYWGILFRHALRMIKDEELAKDTVQDLFVSVLQKSREGAPLPTSLSSYLYTSIRNRIIDLVEKQKVRQNYLSTLAAFSAPGAEGTDHRIRERQLAARIEQEIEGLPEKMREIFELHRKENLTYKEIAEHLSLSDKTVKKQVSNALHILRQKLQLLVFFFGL